MKHNIIKTDNYLLVVDESEIKVGDWYYVPRTNKAYKCEYDPTELEMEKRFGVREVIAHLPLNGSPILEGVPLLPPIGEDGNNKDLFYQKQVMNPYPTGGQSYASYENGFIDGYNKAKEKYKYTEEDLRKAWNAAYIDAMSIDEETYKPLFFEDFIQSLSQPKMPIEFECVTQKLFKHNEFMEREFYDSILTTTTPEGHTEWMGIYIY